MRRVKNIVKWYVKSGLFHPVVLFLIAITALGFYSTLENYESALRYTMVTTVLEYTLLPLYMLAAGLHLVRSPLVVIFEVNMFKDWRSLFIAKLASFTLSWVPLAIIICAMAYAMGEHRLVTPLVVRFIVYTSLLAVCL